MKTPGQITEKSQQNYTAEIQPNAEASEKQSQQQPSEKESKMTKEEEEKAIMDGLDATEEELAGAATKISAAFKGRQARRDVAAKKAGIEESKAEADQKDVQHVENTPKADPEEDKSQKIEEKSQQQTEEKKEENAEEKNSEKQEWIWG